MKTVRFELRALLGFAALALAMTFIGCAQLAVPRTAAAHPLRSPEPPPDPFTARVVSIPKEDPDLSRRATNILSESHVNFGVEARNDAMIHDWQPGENSVTLAAAVLLIIVLLFPAAVPVAGRILGSLVNQVPSLAGPAGIVSVKAFDALITAIERSKKSPRFENDANAVSSSRDELRANLSRELDASHKRLVRARRRTLNTGDSR
jgi:hypothetical protein